MRKVINIDKEIMGGMPVFMGTRVPIKNLFDCLKGGEPVSEFLDDFPSVDKAVLSVVWRRTDSGLDKLRIT